MSSALATWQIASNTELTALEMELRTAMASLREVQRKVARVSTRIAAGAEKIASEVYDRCDQPEDADAVPLSMLDELPSIDAEQVGAAIEALADLRQQVIAGRRAVAAINPAPVSDAA